MRRSNCIFLPGFMCDGRLFEAQKRALEAAGHTCFDGSLTGADTLEDLAAALLEKAPDNFAVIGLSMGGIVALELMRQAPQRVSRLALLNTTHRADRAGEKRIAQLARVQRGELDLVLREELKPTYMHPANRTPERLDLLARMANELGDKVFKRQTRALMYRRSYTDLLPKIGCPTMVLTGLDDSVCPPSLHEEMARAIPNAQKVILQQCGHLSTIEQPEAVSEALLTLLERETRSETSQL